ncbi:hypothetical protein BX070DRAFT_223021 [Coemansia spiralis]|nr:hypothetical protein BX070DRAFT_223021 [Coemansia spiralis]
MEKLITRQDDETTNSLGQFYSGPINPVFSPSEFTGLFVLNGISTLCSLFVVGFIHMYRNKITKVAATRPKQQLHRRKPQRRRTILKPVGTQAAMYLSLPASLRLLFIASIIDVLYSGFRIYNLAVNMPEFQGAHQANCQASMAGITFFNLMSVFVRALLSVHLQLVILNNVNRALVYERHFLIAALVISLVLSILPLITGNYVWITFDPTLRSAHCGYFPLHKTTDDMTNVSLQFIWTEDMARKAMQRGLVIMWATNFAWLTLTVFYGVVVIVSVIIRLVHQRRAIQSIALQQDMLFEGAHRRREFIHMAAKVVRRILQFPLMVVVCHVLEVVYGMATLSNAIQLIRTRSISSVSSNSANDNIPGFSYGLTRLYLASNVMLGMEGIITLFFLPLEPPIRYMLHNVYIRKSSGLRRLGTLSRSTPRRKLTEYWPSARPALQQKPADLETISSILLIRSPSLPFNSPNSVTQGYKSGSRSAPQMLQQLALAGGSGLEAHRICSEQTEQMGSPLLVTFDHYEHCTYNSKRARINNDDTPGDSAQSLDFTTRNGSEFLRRTTNIWRHKTAGRAYLAKEGTDQVKRPVPVYRSRTLGNFPREGASPPQPHLQGMDIDVVARGVMELRNDGLPAHQWYVPEEHLAADQPSSTATGTLTPSPSSTDSNESTVDN